MSHTSEDRPTSPRKCAAHAPVLASHSRVCSRSGTFDDKLASRSRARFGITPNSSATEQKVALLWAILASYLPEGAWRSAASLWAHPDSPNVQTCRA